MKNFIYFFIIFLFACSGEISSSKKQLTDSVKIEAIKDELPANTERTVDEKEDFLSFYKEFTDAIIEGDLDKTNECINPDGVYFIESTGALPHFQKVFDVKTFKTSKPQTFFNLPFLEIEQQPIFEVLPNVICSVEIYDKLGCFAEEVNHLKESSIWNYSNLSEEEKKVILFAIKTINITVINTQNFTFYFSNTEEGWRLTFMDIRTPCAA